MKAKFKLKMKTLLITLLLPLNLWAQVTTQIDVPGVKVTPPSPEAPTGGAALGKTGSNDSPSGKKAKGLSTNIYEKDNAAKTFSTTVKIIREFQGEWEVMFNGHTGFYTVKDESQAILVEAEKKKANVIVKVDEESKHVISAAWGAPGAGAGGGSGPGR